MGSGSNSLKVHTFYVEKSPLVFIVSIKNLQRVDGAAVISK